MILSDFLSRLKQNTSDPHEIIPISLIIQGLLHARYYYLQKKTNHERYFVQIRSHAMNSGTVLPKVHGIDKGVDPHLK